MASKSKIKRKFSSIKTTVLGIGRVGLPLALFLAEKKQTVYGIDVDLKKVDFISGGRMPFIEEGAPALLKKHLGKLR